MPYSLWIKLPLPKVQPVNTCTAYSAGGAAYTSFLIFCDEANNQNAELWLYETMECIGTGKITDFGGTASNLFRLGDWSAADEGEIHIEGWPAIAIMEKM